MDWRTALRSISREDRRILMLLAIMTAALIVSLAANVPVVFSRRGLSSKGATDSAIALALPVGAVLAYGFRRGSVFVALAFLTGGVFIGSAMVLGYSRLLHGKSPAPEVWGLVGVLAATSVALWTLIFRRERA